MGWQTLNKILNVLLIVIISGYVIYYFYRQPKFDLGEQAKDFETVLADGSSFKLSELKGRYILLDFWGSWCGPCRKENPALVDLYYKIKDKRFKNASGFDIVSVALENNPEKWKQAMMMDGLVWKYQIGEMERLSGPVASLYGIKEIPTKYFISPEGLIIMVNPKIDEIKSYLLEREEK